MGWIGTFWIRLGLWFVGGLCCEFFCRYKDVTTSRYLGQIKYHCMYMGILIYSSDLCDTYYLDEIPIN